MINILQPPRVLCDVDGILANFTRAYLDIAYHQFGIQKQESDIDQWDIGDALRLTYDQKEVIHRWLYTPGMGMYLPVYQDAIEGVRALSCKGDLWFVTSPLDENPTWCFERSRWLEWNLGEPREAGGPYCMRVPLQCPLTHRPLFKKVIHTPDKSFIKGDIFIDDKPANVMAWADANPEGVAFLWDLPHNAKAKKEAELVSLPSSAGTRQIPRLRENIYITRDWDVPLSMLS
jgi:5'(3')-deoxyribonucleotidase